MLSLLARPLALALALCPPLTWGETAGPDEAPGHADSAPAEGLVTSISSIKRLTDGTLSCAQIRSRIEVLQQLSVEADRHAEAMMPSVEQAQAELTASATISQTPAPAGFAMGAAVTALEAIPFAGSMASSLIVPSQPSPSLPPRSAQAQVSALNAVRDAGRSQITQFATASRHDHLRQLHMRGRCASRSE